MAQNLNFTSVSPLTNLTDWSGVSCHIFCNVIDNFGDIGVCWRLARILAHQYHLQVTLWVDDLATFSVLCPRLDISLADQYIEDIQILFWPQDFNCEQAATLVIEAFACHLPESYVKKMAQKHSIWINLEYLSAEDWVEECHLLPSPHPHLAITKYFFFPGFSARTGGLMCEADLLARLSRFNRVDFLAERFGIAFNPEVLLISLFAYPNKRLEHLLDVWAKSITPICCFVPEGRLLPQLAAYFGDNNLKAGAHYQRGALSIIIIPFLSQQDYDLLLASCDFNFVRGEDSFVRAQLIAKPLFWHIYPQDDGVHLLKKDAFLNKYLSSMDAELVEYVTKFWHFWNENTLSPEELSLTWQQLQTNQEALTEHAKTWSEQCLQQNLVLNLLNFCQKVGTIAPFV